MAEQVRRDDQPIPGWQIFFDNIWLLFLLGIVIPTVIFTVWGLIEVTQIPQLPMAP
ncbi:MAG: hypothetical protein HY880_03340 [Deltaproteobacteria bacterium]|nr:hypothetical protein [Deltaproteobacteria bacterium]